MNRVFDSSGPEGKVRGTPQQIIEKYQQLTRDAQLSGDRVAAENFQQHAEHYMRLLAEAQREIEARREQQDRENREKQAQRDQERSDRVDARRDRGDDEPNKMPSALDVADFSDAPQPDLAPLNPEDLAQTPPIEPTKSAEPAKPRLRRRPAKPASDALPAADAEAQPAPLPEE